MAGVPMWLGRTAAPAMMMTDFPSGKFFPEKLAKKRLTKYNL